MEEETADGKYGLTGPLVNANIIISQTPYFWSLNKLYQASNVQCKWPSPVFQLNSTNSVSCFKTKSYYFPTDLIQSDASFKNYERIFVWQIEDKSIFVTCTQKQALIIQFIFYLTVNLVVQTITITYLCHQTQ